MANKPKSLPVSGIGSEAFKAEIQMIADELVEAQTNLAAEIIGQVPDRVGANIRGMFLAFQWSGLSASVFRPDFSDESGDQNP